MAPDPSTDHAATPKDQPSCAARTPPKVSPDEMRAVARKFADQPVQDTGPGVWALLTAISKKARLRPQVPPTGLPSTLTLNPCLTINKMLFFLDGSIVLDY
jgi:hypothetical protein